MFVMDNHSLVTLMAVSTVTIACKPSLYKPHGHTSMCCVHARSCRLTMCVYQERYLALFAVNASLYLYFLIIKLFFCEIQYKNIFLREIFEVSNLCSLIM